MRIEIIVEAGDRFSQSGDPFIGLSFAKPRDTSLVSRTRRFGNVLSEACPGSKQRGLSPGSNQDFNVYDFRKVHPVALIEPSDLHRRLVPGNGNGHLIFAGCKVAKEEVAIVSSYGLRDHRPAPESQLDYRVVDGYAID